MKRRDRQTGFLNLDLGPMFAGLIIAGVAIGLVLAFVVPWLWSVIKPIIHAVTA